jgi:hypothetical protein
VSSSPLTFKQRDVRGPQAVALLVGLPLLLLRAFELRDWRRRELSTSRSPDSETVTV